MANATAEKFGYPETLVAETVCWLVLVRPAQPTLGSLVLVCKEATQAFSGLSAQAFAELQQVVVGVERLLGGFVGYQKINYLMLMMVDRDVHFHVIPRYEGARERDGVAFVDAGWPAQPILAEAVQLDPGQAADLTQALRTAWVAQGADPGDGAAA